MSQFVATIAVLRGVVDGRLTAADCRLLACVQVVLALAAAAVSCATIPAARAALRRVRPWAIFLGGPAPETRVVWAIEASGRWPAGHSTCLTRALAAELLLQPGDRPLRVVIGVASPVDGHLTSHAWIERDGRVLIGGCESRQHYIPLIAWNGGNG
jgi:hypothetical protein